MIVGLPWNLPQSLILWPLKSQVTTDSGRRKQCLYLQKAAPSTAFHANFHYQPERLCTGEVTRLVERDGEMSFSSHQQQLVFLLILENCCSQSKNTTYTKCFDVIIFFREIDFFSHLYNRPAGNALVSETYFHSSL